MPTIQEKIKFVKNRRDRDIKTWKRMLAAGHMTDEQVARATALWDGIVEDLNVIATAETGQTFLFDMTGD